MIGQNPFAKYPGPGWRPVGPAGRLDRELTESTIGGVYPFAGLLDDVFDQTGSERWAPIGGALTPYGEDLTLLGTEQGHALMRQLCRYLFDENPYAINAIENRINFIVGDGMTLQFVPRDPDVDTQQPQVKKKLNKLNKLLKDELDRLDFYGKEVESVRRGDRDGEVFLRVFRGFEGAVEYRFIEPGQVRQPSLNVKAPFGIETDPLDVTKVITYWVDGEAVPADEVYHLKCNVDSNVRRGKSTLWPIRQNLHRAAKLQKGISAQAQYQASICAIRTHEVGDANSVRTFADNRANFELTDPATGSTRRVEKLNAGRVIDTSSKIKWDFPSVGVGMDKLDIAKQGDLRAAAARLVMPEHMFTSDASNNNYASMLAADGPSARMFRRAQRLYGRFFADAADDVVIAAVENGRLPANTLDEFRLEAVPADISHRDPKVESDANKTKHDAGVLSRRTWAARDGLDYDRERQNILEEEDQSATDLPPVDPQDPKQDPPVA